MKEGRQRCSVLRLMLVLILSAGSAYGQTAVIGDSLYTGADDGTGPVMTPDAPILLEARVMVHNQHAGGTFITHGTVTGNQWEATATTPGDYVVMFALFLSDIPIDYVPHDAGALCMAAALRATGG